jgi:hypothetical protein
MNKKFLFTLLSTSIKLKPESFVPNIVNVRTVIPFANK